MDPRVVPFLLFCLALHAAEPGVSIRVRGPIVPVISGDKVLLVYELDVTNGGVQAIGLDKLEAPGLFTYDPPTLLHNTRQIAPPRDGQVKQLRPGARAAVFCWIEHPAGDPIPGTIAHTLTFHEGKGPAQTVAGEATAVELRTEFVFGPPLGAGDWWAAIGPSNTSEHRRAQVRIDGNSDAPFAQRFATDWVELSDTKSFRRRGIENADYFGYGKEVLAVADARVAVVKDGVPDNKPGEGSRAINITKETLLGNHVVLELGRGRYAIYAHLKPGSVSVSQGGLVKKGQLIGRLGNSGNSDSPHLHLHVAQAASVEQVVWGQGDALPYAFEQFEIVGQFNGNDAPKRQKAEVRRGELPRENVVVRFPVAEKP